MDPDRLRTFVATEYPRVVAAVTLVCGDSSAAEDAVQEALARACEQLARGAHIRNLAAWVTTVASNHTRTGFRRSERERRALVRLAVRESPDEPDSRADAIAVHHAVSQLPRRQRHAVVLRYFLGLDIVEVAAELGVAEGTAKALLYQGRNRLAHALGEPADPPHSGDTAGATTNSEVGP